MLERVKPAHLPKDMILFQVHFISFSIYKHYNDKSQILNNLTELETRILQSIEWIDHTQDLTFWILSRQFNIQPFWLVKNKRWTHL